MINRKTFEKKTECMDKLQYFTGVSFDELRYTMNICLKKISMNLNCFKQNDIVHLVKLAEVHSFEKQ